MFEQLSSGPCAFAQSDLTFRLTGIQIEGVPDGYDAGLRNTYADRVGREIPVGDICLIRDKIAHALLSQNLLARVEIPAQKIEDGTAKIIVEPGHFQSVVVVGEGRSIALVRSILAPLEELRYIDLDVAQRYLLLASDLPGVEIAPVIRAGTERGGLQLEVHVRQRTMRASLGVNNLNSKSQGRVSGYVRVDFMGLAGLGDQTSFIVSSTSDFEELQVYQILESLHLGSNGLVLRGSATLANGRPGGQVSVLDLRTRSFLGNVELNYPLIRHRRHNLNLAGGLDIVAQRTKAFRTIPLSDEKLRVVYARISGNVSSRFGARPASISGSLEVRKGLSTLGASENGDADLSRADSDPQAFVLRGSANGQILLAPSVSLAVSAMGQYTADPLLSFEQLGVGNLSIGRGYDPNAVPGDRGIAGSVEARFGPFPVGSTTLAPFAFYDHARTTALGANGYSITLRSAGGGVRMNLFGPVNAAITYAHPFDTTYPGGRRASDRALFNISAKFF